MRPEIQQTYLVHILLTKAEDSNRKYFQEFIQYLQNACRVLYPEKPPVLASDGKTINSPLDLAMCLSEDGRAAADFFDNVIYLINYKVENIEQCFNLCNQYNADEQSCPPIEHVLQTMPSIVTGLFIQIVKKIFDESICKIVDDVMNFCAWLKST